MSVPPPSVFAVTGGVFLQGAALADVSMLVSYAVQTAAAADTLGTVAPRLRKLADFLAEQASEAAMSRCGHADMVSSSTVAPSLVDELTTKEAAGMLHITPRHMARLAPELGGRRTSAGWLVRRGAVVAHLQNKETAA